MEIHRHVSHECVILIQNHAQSSAGARGEVWIVPGSRECLPYFASIYPANLHRGPNLMRILLTLVRIFQALQEKSGNQQSM